MKINKNLVKDIQNVVDYSSNADDRTKAKVLLNRCKRPNTRLVDQDCIEFLANIEHEDLHLPQEN